MTKPVVTLRNTKGSALSYTELDTNFSNLKDATVGFTVGSDTANIDLNSALTVVAGSNVSLSLNTTTKTLTISSSASGGTLSNIVEDTSPQLGGDLDVNGYSIIGSISGGVTLKSYTGTSGAYSGQLTIKDDGYGRTVLSAIGSTVVLSTATNGPNIQMLSSSGNSINQIDIDATYNGSAFGPVSIASSKTIFRTDNSSADPIQLSSSIGVGSDPTTGFKFIGRYVQLPSRTTTQRNAVTAVNGMLLYNSTTNTLQAYTNSTWTDIDSAAASSLTGTTLASNIVSSSLTSVGTLTGVTSNASTAFIAGSAAISGVALQVPQDGGIRNVYNGENTMFFDVSNGGSTHGHFEFRGTSSFTQYALIDNNGIKAISAYKGKTSWNAAIDTELTVDDYRFRVHSSTGIYPEIISNTGGTKNTAWTAVAALNGTAISQTGSTGVSISNSAWSSLYNSHGMDAAGDTVTVTLQDKAQGKIYRITFMRSDNGSTTGYNIIVERIL